MIIAILVSAGLGIVFMVLTIWSAVLILRARGYAKVSLKRFLTWAGLAAVFIIILEVLVTIQNQILIK